MMPSGHKYWHRFLGTCVKIFGSNITHYMVCYTVPSRFALTHIPTYVKICNNLTVNQYISPPLTPIAILKYVS